MMKLTSDILNDLPALQKIPKSDLHNHAGRGGTIAYISQLYHTEIMPPNHPFQDLSEMQQWFLANIKSVCQGLDGYLKRIQASFHQANLDHISVLALSFGKNEIDALGGMVHFMSAIDLLHRSFAPDTLFLPELSFGREQSESDILSWLEEILDYGWFRSVDICNDELAQPIKNFKRIYRIVEKYPLRRKAHVGEFGTADDVMEAVELLHLHEVHHGIAAASSPQIMKWLANHNIQLNVCPGSNIMLNRAESYAAHPINILAANGIPVTLNTDDLLIFNHSVSQEYQNLFLADALTCEELELIRLQGLSAASCRRTKKS